MFCDMFLHVRSKYIQVKRVHITLQSIYHFIVRSLYLRTLYNKYRVSQCKFELDVYVQAKIKNKR